MFLYNIFKHLCFENVKKERRIYLDKYDKIAFEFESAWKNITPEVQRNFLFAEKYKILNHGKTERECIQIIRGLKKRLSRYTGYHQRGHERNKYANNRGKSATYLVAKSLLKDAYCRTHRCPD